MEKERYTLKNLFLPRLRGRPWREIPAMLMLNPIVWLCELTVWIIFAVGSAYQASVLAPHMDFVIILVATVATIVFPVIYLLFMWLLDIFEREPLRFIISLFLWGVASAGGAFIVNTCLGLILVVIGSLIGGETGGQLAAVVGTSVFIAPVVEECLKGLGVIIMAGHHEMDDTYDGILFGFSAGIGFAAVENLFYFSAAFKEGQTTALEFLGFVLYRSIICMIGHGCFTATTGILMGFLKGRGRLAKFAQFGGLIGLFGAMLLHGIFNAAAIGQEITQAVVFGKLTYPLPMFHGPLIFLMAFIYFIIIIFALIESRARIIREDAYEKERQRQKQLEQAGAKCCRECNTPLPQGRICCDQCGTMN